MKKLLLIAVAVLFCLIGCSKNTDNKASQSNEESNAKPVLKKAMAKQPQSNENSQSSATPGLKEAMAKPPRNLDKNPLLTKGDLEVDPNTLEPYSGKVLDFYEDKQTIRNEFLLLNGKMHGMATSYRNDGTKKENETYKEGKQHGLKTWYRKDGTKEQEAYFKEDKRHGLTTWYHKDETKKEDAHFKDGKQQGPQTWYRKDGTQVAQCEWSDGVKGQCKEF